jgi:hypothetical protein
MGFHKLDRLDFSCCSFTDNDVNNNAPVNNNQINIFLPHTSIKELHLCGDEETSSDFDEVMKSLLLFSITIEESGNGFPSSNYYINSRDDGDGAVEITGTRFGSFCNAFRPEEVTVINVLLNAVDIIVFSAGYHGFRIEFY